MPPREQLPHRYTSLLSYGLNDHYDNMVGCLQVTRIHSFMKEIKVYIRASYIIFLFVKGERNAKTNLLLFKSIGIVD